MRPYDRCCNLKGPFKSILRRLRFERLELRLPLAVDSIELLSAEGEHGEHLSGDDHPHAIYAPGTTTKHMEQYPDALDPHGSNDQASYFQLAGRWTSTATDGGGLGQGDPTTLTWTIVQDGTGVPGFSGEPSAPTVATNPKRCSSTIRFISSVSTIAVYFPNPHHIRRIS